MRRTDTRLVALLALLGLIAADVGVAAASPYRPARGFNAQRAQRHGVGAANFVGSNYTPASFSRPAVMTRDNRSWTQRTLQRALTPNRFGMGTGKRIGYGLQSRLHTQAKYLRPSRVGQKSGGAYSSPSFFKPANAGPARTRGGARLSRANVKRDAESLAIPRVAPLAGGQAAQRARALARSGQLTEAASTLAAAKAENPAERRAVAKARRTVIRKALGQLASVNGKMNLEGVRQALGAVVALRQAGQLGVLARSMIFLARREGAANRVAIARYALEGRDLGFGANMLEISNLLAPGTIGNRLANNLLSRKALFVGRALSGERGAMSRMVLNAHLLRSRKGKDVDLSSALAAMEISYAAALRAGRSGAKQLEYAEKFIEQGAKRGDGQAALVGMEFVYPLLLANRQRPPQQLFDNATRTAELLARNYRNELAGEHAIGAIGFALALAQQANLDAADAARKGAAALLRVSERLNGHGAFDAAAHAIFEAKRMALRDPLEAAEMDRIENVVRQLGPERMAAASQKATLDEAPREEEAGMRADQLAAMKREERKIERRIKRQRQPRKRTLLGRPGTEEVADEILTGELPRVARAGGRGSFFDSYDAPRGRGGSTLGRLDGDAPVGDDDVGFRREVDVERIAARPGRAAEGRGDGDGDATEWQRDNDAVEDAALDRDDDDDDDEKKAEVVGLGVAIGKRADRGERERRSSDDDE